MPGLIQPWRRFIVYCCLSRLYINSSEKSSLNHTVLFLFVFLQLSLSYHPAILVTAAASWLGGLTHRHLFGSPRSRGWQIQWLSPVLQIAVFSLLVTWHRAERARGSSPVSSYKGTNPIHEGPTWIITSQRPHLLISGHKRLRFQHMNLGSKQTFSP
jgi:hypothetical protein